MTFPEKFDWREHNGYTEAKDQGGEGECFSCWSYSLIGGVESAIKIATGEDFDLSEQQLIDCNTNGYGCDGGFKDGWTALRDYGAVLESCYPFVADDTDCAESDLRTGGVDQWRLPCGVYHQRHQVCIDESRRLKLQHDGIPEVHVLSGRLLFKGWH